MEEKFKLKLATANAGVTSLHWFTNTPGSADAEFEMLWVI